MRSWLSMARLLRGSAHHSSTATESLVRLLFAAEQLLDFRMAELHPGGAAMVALTGARRRLHFAQQRVHFRHRQHPARPHRAVAGDSRRDMVEAVAQAE